MRNIFNHLKPPESVKGMIKLDKNLFNKEISLSVIQFKDVKISTVLPLFKKYLLKMENFKAIQVNENITSIYLNPEKVADWLDISESDRNVLESLNITKNSMTNVQQTIGYDNFTAEDIFKSILPPDKEGIASFTNVGHIVHINLREHLLPYKHVIGQVLLDKVPRCKTVVNKTNNIDNIYRNFKMEILSGEDNMMVKLKESGCTFEFDFSSVYWNSRLCTEHERIIKKLNPGDILFDVFAGIGPFAIPAAKRKCFVYANDLNPDSYKWLNHNIKLNKIHTNYIKTYNKDGRDFIIQDVKENLLQYINTPNSNVYIVMNLPALATEFINAFYKLYDISELNAIKSNPTLFLYCFAKGEDPIKITKQLINNGIGFNIDEKIMDIFKVRTVSSFKEMMRVTIKLDEDILVNKQTLKRKTVEEDTNSVCTKKC